MFTTFLDTWMEGPMDNPTRSRCTVKLSWLENAYSRPDIGGFGDFDQ